MVTRKIGNGILNDIKELELDYMKHDNMRIRGHKRSHGIFRRFKVMVKSQMMLFNIFEIVKSILMSLRLVYFHIQSLMLRHEQINNTEHFS